MAVEIKIPLSRDDFSSYTKDIDLNSVLMLTELRIVKAISINEVNMQIFPFIKGVKQSGTFKYRINNTVKNIGDVVITKYDEKIVPNIDMKTFKFALFRLSITDVNNKKYSNLPLQTEKIETKNQIWKYEYLIEAFHKSEESSKFSITKDNLFMSLPTDHESLNSKTLFGNCYLVLTGSFSELGDQWLDKSIELIDTLGYHSNDSFNEAIDKVNHMLSKNASSIKQICHQVIGINRYIYKNNVQNNSDKFLITEKADGTRALLVVDRDKKSFILDQKVKYLDSIICDNKAIFDIEVVDGKMYAIDLLYLNKPITNLKLTERLEKMNILISECKLPLIPKQYHTLTPENIDKVYKSKYDYEIDGIIINENSDYFGSQIYKWKPPQLLTIDFEIRKPASSMIGVGSNSTN